jgi:hypothetical protein
MPADPKRTLDLYVAADRLSQVSRRLDALFNAGAPCDCADLVAPPERCPICRPLTELADGARKLASTYRRKAREAAKVCKPAVKPKLRVAH